MPERGAFGVHLTPPCTLCIGPNTSSGGRFSTLPCVCVNAREGGTKGKPSKKAVQLAAVLDGK